MELSTIPVYAVLLGTDLQMVAKGMEKLCHLTIWLNKKKIESSQYIVMNNKFLEVRVELNMTNFILYFSNLK